MLDAEKLFEITLKQRMLFLVGPITAETSYEFIRMLHILNQDDSTKEITIIVNSPGGSVIDGNAIIDTLKMIDAPVRFVVNGIAASMAATILMSCNGPKFTKVATPNSLIMIHEPLITQAGGKAKDLGITDTLLHRFKAFLIKIIQHGTKIKDYEKAKRSIEIDRWLTAQQALELGIIDGITPYSAGKEEGVVLDDVSTEDITKLMAESADPLKDIKSDSTTEPEKEEEFDL
jgi:ATP-dependent Clp protease protease subunit